MKKWCVIGSRGGVGGDVSLCVCLYVCTYMCVSVSALCL